MSKDIFIDTPIDPEARVVPFREALLDSFEHPEKVEEEHPGLELLNLGMKRHYFRIFLDTMRALSEFITTKEKVRIVIEYDPNLEKFHIGAVKERGADAPEEAAENDG